MNPSLATGMMPWCDCSMEVGCVMDEEAGPAGGAGGAGVQNLNRRGRPERGPATQHNGRRAGRRVGHNFFNRRALKIDLINAAPFPLSSPFSRFFFWSSIFHNFVREFS